MIADTYEERMKSRRYQFRLMKACYHAECEKLNPYSYADESRFEQLAERFEVNVGDLCDYMENRKGVR